MADWHAFLKQIADYVRCDEGVWWQRNGNYVVFMDGDDETDFRKEGPPFKDFTDTKLYEARKFKTTFLFFRILDPIEATFYPIWLRRV